MIGGKLFRVFVLTQKFGKFNLQENESVSKLPKACQIT